MASDDVLGIVRRPDGALALAVPNANPEGVETASAAGILYVITFGRREDAIEARAGVLVRLGKHVGVDTWIFGLSVGQVLATCKAEIDALGLDATSFRIRKPGDVPLARRSGGLRHWLAVVAWLAGFIAIMLALAARGQAGASGATIRLSIRIRHPETSRALLDFAAGRPVKDRD